MSFICSSRLCLASASPRRQQLLTQLGLQYEVVIPVVDEQIRGDESPSEYVQRLALDKARAGRQLRVRGGQHGLPVIGADTAVVVDDHLLGKPEDKAAALAMLTRLSGRWHEVLTAIALVCDERTYTAVNRSRVEFGAVDEETMARYWQSGEPCDKAGAYGIQGMAAAFIKHLDGSYSGVMGLPLYELTGLLKQAGLVNH
ncbi:MAG: nucleoside triphosphate pyrophosphatase [Gammaproteobacteria bacterium]|nr:MAG: nucleoside triphosphate pyrophosphatase [Gammaproteobacteria bacterium]